MTNITRSIVDDSYLSYSRDRHNSQAVFILAPQDPWGLNVSVGRQSRNLGDGSTSEAEAFLHI